MKKIFLTGSTGFIGKNLKQFLSLKYKVFSPSHQQLDLLDSSKVDNYFKKNNPEIVIHTAFVGGPRNNNNKNLVYPNQKMLVNLLKNEKYFKKLIFLGSGAEYGRDRNLKKIKESDFGQIVPNDEYGRSKYICSRLIEKNKKSINLRLFGVYGKYEDYKIRFISNAVLKMLFNLPISINQNVVFDYLYINDLVKIIDYFIKHKSKHQFYNVGSGKSIDLKSIAKLILKLSGKKLPIKIFKAGLNKEYTANVARLKKEIPNLKFTSLNKGISELIEYYKKILKSINKKDLYEVN